MYWTFDLADYMHEAPWPATKKMLTDFCHREGLPPEILDNISELPDNDEILYTSIEDLWPDYPKRSDYFHDEESEKD